MDEFLGVDGITAIEWPEIISWFLPEDTINVYFEFVDEIRRRIFIPADREA